MDSASAAQYHEFIILFNTFSGGVPLLRFQGAMQSLDTCLTSEPRPAMLPLHAINAISECFRENNNFGIPGGDGAATTLPTMHIDTTVMIW
jgi:hypothetical protein